MGSLAQRATQTGAQMTRALTLPAGLIGGTIIKEAADFERTLNVLVNTTRNAGDNVVDAAAGFDDATRRAAAFRAEALKLGADLDIPNTSASDAASAMDELAKAGLSVTTTLSAARGVVLLAAAGNMEVKDAADLSSAALKQFGLQGKDMERVTNMMARATEVSRIKFQDMAVGLRQGGAAMATLGVPMEGFLAILGSLVDRGVSGGVAATSLRRAISAVASPTAKATAAMEKYNIELFNAEGRFIGFPGLIDELNESLGPLTDKERFAAIKDIFGQEGFKSIAPLLTAAKDGSEAFQELNEQFADGEINADQYQEALAKLEKTGTKFSDQLRATEKDIAGSNAAFLISQARMKGLSGALEGLQSSWETMAVVIGTPFLTRLANVTSEVAKMVTRFGEFMDVHPRLLEFVATFGAMVAAVGPALFLFGRLLTMIGMLFTPLGMATVAIAAFAGAWNIDFQGIQQRTNNLFDSLRENIQQAGIDFHNWGAFTGDAESAIGESLSGIGGMVLAFQFAMQQNWPAAQKAWEAAMDNFGRALEHGKRAAGNFVSEIITIIGDLVGIDVREITGWAEKLGALFGVDVTGIAGTWNQLIAIAQTVMNRVLAIFGTGLDTVAGMLGIDTTTIEGNWNKIVAIAQGVIDKIKAIFTQTIDTALGFLGIDPSTIETNWMKLVTIAQQVWAGVNAAFSRALDIAGNLFGIDVAGTSSNWQKLQEITEAAAGKIEDASARIGAALKKLEEAKLPEYTPKKSLLDELIASAPLIGAAVIALEGALKNASEAISLFLDALADSGAIRVAAGLIAGLGVAIQIVTLGIAGSVDIFRTFIRIVGELSMAIFHTLKGFGQMALGLKEITTGDVAKGFELFAEGGKSFQIAADAEKRVTGEIDGFFSRLDARIKANSTSTLAAMADALFGGAPPVFNAAGADAARAFDEGLHELPAQTAATIGAVADETAIAVEGIVPATETALAPLDATFNAAGADAARAFDEGLHELPANVQSVVDEVPAQIEQAAPEAGTAGTTFGEAVINGISTALAAITPTAFAEELTTTIEEGVPAAEEAGAVLGTGVVSGLETAVAEAPAAVDVVPSTVSDAMDRALVIVQGIGEQINSAISSTWDTVAGTVAAALAPLVASIETTMTQAVSTVQTSGTQILSTFTTTFTQVEASVTTAMAAIQATVTSSFAQLVAIVTSSGAQILATMTTTWAQIEASAAATWAQITATVTTSVATATAAVTTGGAQMTAAIAAAGASMVSAMQSAMTTMAAAASSGVQQVIGAVSALVGSASAAGASIGNAIATGLSGAISAGASRAAAAAAGAVSSAISAARAAADAQSPSRKMARLGTDMIDGLAQALSGGQSRVADAIKIVVKEALDVGIDPLIALALAKAESGFNARAAGDRGASIGLFQLHERGQGAGMTRAQREDPTVNARKFLQSHAELFKRLRGEISDTTELARRFGVEAEQPADKTGQAYATAYQQIREQIAAAGGAVAEMAGDQDAFTAALGESVETAASLEPLLERQLALKEEMALIDVQMLGGKQNLERLERQIAMVESGTREERLAALQGNRQDNALLQQELQLKLMLAKAEAAAPRDTKTGKARGSQEVADIKAALELLGQQREEISLTAQLTKAENAARAMGLREQALLQEEALRPMEDQRFMIGQQVAQIDALNSAWQAAQTTIQNANSTENAARREVIATMREQAGANADIRTTGQAALQEMLASGRITQQEFERYTSILQSFGATVATGTQGAVSGIQAIGTASSVAGEDVAATGQALATTGVQMQQVGQAGTQAAQTLATTAAQGFTTFATDAMNAAQEAVNNVIAVLNNAGATANAAGYNLGVNVGQGLTNGIIESGNQAIDAAIAVANAVIEAMRGPEGFDARSPARKSYFIGQDVMAGLIKGLQDPNVGDEVKKRIQQYIDYAEGYRKLIPEAIDNEMRIIETRIAQAKALLGILDLEMRMKEAQRAAEDARRGSVEDQLRLLTIEKERNELRLKELDHLRNVQKAQDAIEATERAIKLVEEGTLEERLRLLAIDHQSNLLKREQLLLEQQIAAASSEVEATRRAIEEIERGTLAEQYRALEIEHQRTLIRQQELAMADDLLAARWAIEDTEKQIRNIERGTLADRQHELAIDHQKNVLSKERIKIEQRLRQIHEAGIAKDLAAFHETGLQVVDPNDPLQREVNQLHNRLALIEDQNELLEDESEIRRLNGQIASYEYRLQLLSQEDMLDALEAQQQILDRQNELLQLESDIRENNVELATYALQVQLVAQEATLTALQDQATALEHQIELLTFEGELRQINADISKYALLVQLETQQEVLTALEQQTTAYARQNQALDEEAERIRIANELRAYGAAAQAIVLEEEERIQQRIIDDLDRQYEALNRQKQVYDAILRAVDYLHDHLIDIGILADPFAREEHEPVGPGAGGAGGAGSRAGGAARTAGGALAKAGRDVSKSMQDAAKDTDTFVGNAAAALARLRPVVTDAATNIGTTGAAFGETAAQAGKIQIELGMLASRAFKVNVDGTTIRESEAAATELEGAATELAAKQYNIQVGSDTIRVSSEQAVGLREAIEGVEAPVAINVNGQQVELTTEETAELRNQLHYLNSVRATLSVEDQAIVDARYGITDLELQMTTIDQIVAEPEIVPVVDPTPIQELDTAISLERVLDVATTVDPEPLVAADAVIEAEHILDVVTAVDATQLTDTVAMAATVHPLMLDDTLDRTDTDLLIADALAVDPVMLDDVLDRTDMDDAIAEAAKIHPLGMDDILDREDMDDAIAEAKKIHPLNEDDVVVTEDMEAAIDEAAADHALNVTTATVTEDMVAAIDEAAADHVLAITSEVDTGSLDEAVGKAEESYTMETEVQVDSGALDEVIGKIEEGYEMEVDVEVNEHNGENDATGGVVVPNKMYTVGEFGRELFVPWTKGFIMPHNLTERILDTNRARTALQDYQPLQMFGAGMGGGSVENHMTVNNFNVNYTAMNQEKKGESDVEQVLKDMITMLSIGGS